MNKKVILFFATVGGIAGGYVPYLFGDKELLDGWGVLGGFIGGVLGIWLGVIISKRVG